MSAARVVIEVTAGIVREYDWRALNHPPYDRITRAGKYEVTNAELRELIADSEYHGDIDGCSGIEHPPQTKTMYRRFHKRLIEVAGNQGTNNATTKKPRARRRA